MGKCIDMTLQITYQFICDKCKKKSGRYENKTATIRIARHLDGWLIGDKVHLCGECKNEEVAPLIGSVTGKEPWRK